MNKIVLFDFDGTLVDSMGNLGKIAAETMVKNYGLSFEISYELYMRTSGIPFCQQLESIFPGHKMNNKTVEEFEKTKIANIYENRVFEDSKETIEYLKEKNYITAVSSSNFSDIVKEYLNSNGIILDEVLGFGNGLSKGRSHINYMKEKYKVKENEMIMVGDSIKDSELALNAGISFIGKIGINSREDFMKISGINIIDKLLDLKKIL